MAAKFQRKLNLRGKIMAESEIFEVECVDGEIICNGMIPRILNYLPVV